MKRILIEKVCAVAKKVAASVANSTASAATADIVAATAHKKRDEAGDEGDDEDEVCLVMMEDFSKFKKCTEVCVSSDAYSSDSFCNPQGCHCNCSRLH